MDNIPLEWIRNYISKLIDDSIMFGHDTDMGKDCLLRAVHIIDLIKVFKEKR